MATYTPEKATTDTGATETSPKSKGTRPHTGPIARLLAQVSQLGKEYAEYQMESCNWRRMVL